MTSRAGEPGTADRDDVRPGHRVPLVGAYTGWFPYLCVLGAIALLVVSGISWVTAPNWGVRNAIAAPRSIGKVPFQAIKPVDATPTPTHEVARGVVPVTTESLAVAPFSIVIPAIKSNAPIVKMGTGPNRELEPPVPPTTVGWWKYGASPGDATGSAIIAGHINYAGVTGAFAHIGQLNPGDKIIVHGMRDDAKTTLTFSVTGVRTYSKTVLPWAKIFNQNVAGRLVLVTCGGPFNASTGNYLDNIVAYATLDT